MAAPLPALPVFARLFLHSPRSSALQTHPHSTGRRGTFFGVHFHLVSWPDRVTKLQPSSARVRHKFPVWKSKMNSLGKASENSTWPKSGRANVTGENWSRRKQARERRQVVGLKSWIKKLISCIPAARCSSCWLEGRIEEGQVKRLMNKRRVLIKLLNFYCLFICCPRGKKSCITYCLVQKTVVGSLSCVRCLDTVNIKLEVQTRLYERY